MGAQTAPPRIRFEALWSHNVDLKKPAQKAVLHVGGINQDQNDGEPASGKKNKALEE
jgi:hypothetical protein